MDPKLIGTHPAIRGIRRTLRGFANCNWHIVILGEPGVGKSLVGRLIHSLSPRKGNPLRSLNFALATERDQRFMLFGTEPPDASAERQGMIEVATTCLLRNIHQAPPHIQDRLVDALTRGEYRRTPHGPTRRVQCRLIVTTSPSHFPGYRDSTLTSAMRVFFLRLPKLLLPPLRERTQDIPLLAAYYRKRSLGLPPLPPDDSILLPDFLNDYPWRENVTELKACLRAAFVFSHAELLHQKERLEFEKMMMLLEEEGEFSLRQSTAVIERHILERVVGACNGHQIRAARMLGISCGNLQFRQRCTHG